MLLARFEEETLLCVYSLPPFYFIHATSKWLITWNFLRGYQHIYKNFMIFLFHAKDIEGPIPQDFFSN